MVDADEYEDVGELKAMVLQLLEKRGVLAQLRAKVRASVFEAVTTSTTLAKEGELGAGKDDKPSRTTLNTRLSKSLDTQEGMLALLLIYDYLGAMGLEKTSFILYPESQAHMPHRIASGNEDELASELMVDEEAFHKRGKERSEKLRKQLNLGQDDSCPILCTLLSSLSHREKLSRSSSGGDSGLHTTRYKESFNWGEERGTTGTSPSTNTGAYFEEKMQVSTREENFSKNDDVDKERVGKEDDEAVIPTSESDTDIGLMEGEQELECHQPSGQMPIAANKANVGYSQGELTISDDSFMGIRQKSSEGVQSQKNSIITTSERERPSQLPQEPSPEPLHHSTLELEEIEKDDSKAGEKRVDQEKAVDILNKLPALGVRRALPRLVEMPDFSNSGSNLLGETEEKKPPGGPLSMTTTHGTGHSTQEEDSDLDSEIQEDIFTDDDSSDEEEDLEISIPAGGEEGSLQQGSEVGP